MNTDFVDRLLTLVALASVGLDHNRPDVVRQQIDGMRELLIPELNKLELEEAQLWWRKQQEFNSGKELVRLVQQEIGNDSSDRSWD